MEVDVLTYLENIELLILKTIYLNLEKTVIREDISNMQRLKNYTTSVAFHLALTTTALTLSGATV